MERLCCDRTLWVEADFTSRRHSRASFLRTITQTLTPTTTIKVRGLRNTRGKNNKVKLLTANTIKQIAANAPNLLHFSVRETLLCAKQITIETIGELNNLHTLSFINCDFVNKPNTVDGGSWFKKIYRWLPNLETLKIVGTSFVDDFDIMALGKCIKLRSLSLINCVRVGIAMPYLAIGFRFGLLKLEHLDLRGTSLQNTDILSITQNGHLKEIFLGPMGHVKRLSSCPSNMHNLIMADPRREEPAQQQVLVVNMGPNGPNWRQVEDHELDGLGLNWVREQVEEQKRQRQQHADDHFFIGENGNILQNDHQPQPPLAPVREVDEEPSCSRKRKADDEPDDRPSKRPKKSIKTVDPKLQQNQVNDDVDIEPSESRVGDTPGMGCLHEIDEDFKPDDSLSNDLLPTLVSKGHSLKKLHLAGCAITNSGLEFILTHLPSIEIINIMCTHVTQPFINDMRKTYTNIEISDARPPPCKAGECSIFCAS